MSSKIVRLLLGYMVEYVALTHYIFMLRMCKNFVLVLYTCHTQTREVWENLLEASLQMRQYLCD